MPSGPEVNPVHREDALRTSYNGSLRNLRGTRFDTGLCGRAESTGCVNSGRRWHRRIPFASSADFARLFVIRGERHAETDDSVSPLRWPLS